MVSVRPSAAASCRVRPGRGRGPAYGEDLLSGLRQDDHEPVDDVTCSAVADRRQPLLAQHLGMSVERVAAWGLVRPMLAEMWHVQDTGHTAGGALAVVERLTQVVSSDR